MTKYVYSMLDDTDTIRILYIRRSTSTTFRLTGCLKNVQLRERPCYTALSYTWGPYTDHDPEILLDDTPFKVTKSLYDALTELTPASDLICLWVDQISINQRNPHEKKHQVALMSSVFKQAERVIGWLGPAEQSTRDAFRFLRAFGESAPYVEPQEPLDMLGTFQTSLERDLSHQLIRFLDPASTLGETIARLLQRTWFQRLWVVQEVVLANRLQIRCGCHGIEASQFFTAVERICAITSDPPIDQLRSPYRNANQLRQIRSLYLQGTHFSYPDLAAALSAWKCTDDLDKLNAIYGLLSRDNLPCAWFTPSCGMSAEELYTKFAVAHIDMSSDLEILHFVACGYGIDGVAGITNKGQQHVRHQPQGTMIASWVPDWRTASRPLTMTRSLAHARPEGFSATTSTADYQLDESKQVLRVRAVKVDTVRICGPPYHSRSHQNSNTNICDTFRQWFSYTLNSRKDEEMISQFAFTLIMDGKVVTQENEDLNIPSNEVVNCFGHWCGRNFFEENSFANTDWSPGLEESSRYGNVAEEVCRNRTFFITERGRLGLGPMNASPGSGIYLIHGLKTPFMLQGNEERAVLCGECYVSGLMYRKAEQSERDIYLTIV